MRLGVAQRADDRARHGADVGAPVAADLRLVAHAADRHADELAPERAGDRLAERRLPDARADPTKQRICPEISLRSLATARCSTIRSFTLSRSKWSWSRTARALSRSRLSSVAARHGSGEDPFEVGADHAVLGGGARQPLEAGELAVGRLARLLGKRPPPRAASVAPSSSACSGSPSPSSFWIALSCWRRKYSRCPFSISDCTCDWIFEPSSKHLDLAREDRRDAPEALLDVERLEDLLALGRRDRAQRRGDEVRERAGVVDVRRGELELRGQVRREADDLGEQPLDVPCQRLDLGRLGVVVGKGLDLSDQVRARWQTGSTMRTRCRPPTRICSVPSGNLTILWIDGDGADVVDVVPARRVDRRHRAPSRARAARSPATTSSISRTERSCPIASGIIVWGKTTVSLSGSTGRLAGSSISCSAASRRARTLARSRAFHDDRMAPARGLALGDRERDRQHAVLVAGPLPQPGRRPRRAARWRSNGPYSISICW